MRALLITTLLAGALTLSACPGSIITPLPPGFGPGNYIGQFEGENTSGDFAQIGDLTLTVGAAGQVSGTGTVNGDSVSVTGLLDSTGHLDGNIADNLTEFSGRFTGQLSGSLLSGDFRLAQPAGDDLTGEWDAQFQQ